MVRRNHNHPHRKGELMTQFNSSMSRIAHQVQDRCETKEEYLEVCEELSLFWSTTNKNENDLSPVAKSIWDEWKACKRAKDSNVDEINEWEGP